MFKNKVLLITGGTGSFGNAVLGRFLNSNIAEIRILSRDEKKQESMRKQYSSKKLKFYIGDVREVRSINQAFRGVDYCFHAAALKQVPSCEFHPMEAVRTNILGTENVLDVAIANNVKRLICLSTDKAVYPINAMGISKAMMEKVMVAESRNLSSKDTIICGTRYGNVLGSRGSILDTFINKINLNEPLTITDPLMTRYMMTLEEAVDLVIYAFKFGKTGEIFVRKAAAASIDTFTKAFLKSIKKPDYPVKIIGTRHGEKLYESLMSREESASAKDNGNFFCIPPDLRDLNYEHFFDVGNLNISTSGDYNSNNTKLYSINQMSKVLDALPIIQDYLSDKTIPPEE